MPDSKEVITKALAQWVSVAAAPLDCQAQADQLHTGIAFTKLATLICGQFHAPPISEDCKESWIAQSELIRRLVRALDACFQALVPSDPPITFAPCVDAVQMATRQCKKSPAVIAQVLLGFFAILTVKDRARANPTLAEMVAKISSLRLDILVTIVEKFFGKVAAQIKGKGQNVANSAHFELDFDDILSTATVNSQLSAWTIESLQHSLSNAVSKLGLSFGEGDGQHAGQHANSSPNSERRKTSGVGAWSRMKNKVIGVVRFQRSAADHKRRAGSEGVVGVVAAASGAASAGLSRVLSPTTGVPRLQFENLLQPSATMNVDIQVTSSSIPPNRAAAAAKLIRAATPQKVAPAENEALLGSSRIHKALARRITDACLYDLKRRASKVTPRNASGAPVGLGVDAPPVIDSEAEEKIADAYKKIEEAGPEVWEKLATGGAANLPSDLRQALAVHTPRIEDEQAVVPEEPDLPYGNQQAGAKPIPVSLIRGRLRSAYNLEVRSRRFSVHVDDKPDNMSPTNKYTRLSMRIQPGHALSKLSSNLAAVRRQSSDASMLRSRLDSILDAASEGGLGPPEGVQGTTGISPTPSMHLEDVPMLEGPSPPSLMYASPIAASPSPGSGVKSPQPTSDDDDLELRMFSMRLAGSLIAEGETPSPSPNNLPLLGVAPPRSDTEGVSPRGSLFGELDTPRDTPRDGLAELISEHQLRDGSRTPSPLPSRSPSCSPSPAGHPAKTDLNLPNPEVTVENSASWKANQAPVVTPRMPLERYSSQVSARSDSMPPDPNQSPFFWLDSEKAYDPTIPNITSPRLEGRPTPRKRRSTRGSKVSFTSDPDAMSHFEPLSPPLAISQQPRREPSVVIEDLGSKESITSPAPSPSPPQTLSPPQPPKATTPTMSPPPGQPGPPAAVSPNTLKPLTAAGLLSVTHIMGHQGSPCVSPAHSTSSSFLDLPSVGSNVSYNSIFSDLSSTPSMLSDFIDSYDCPTIGESNSPTPSKTAALAAAASTSPIQIRSLDMMTDALLESTELGGGDRSSGEDEIGPKLESKKSSFSSVEGEAQNASPFFWVPSPVPSPMHQRRTSTPDEQKAFPSGIMKRSSSTFTESRLRRRSRVSFAMDEEESKAGLMPSDAKSPPLIEEDNASPTKNAKGDSEKSNSANVAAGSEGKIEKDKEKVIIPMLNIVDPGSSVTVVDFADLADGSPKTGKPAKKKPKAKGKAKGKGKRKVSISETLLTDNRLSIDASGMSASDMSSAEDLSDADAISRVAKNDSMTQLPQNTILQEQKEIPKEEPKPEPKALLSPTHLSPRPSVSPRPAPSARGPVSSRRRKSSVNKTTLLNTPEGWSQLNSIFLDIGPTGRSTLTDFLSHLIAKRIMKGEKTPAKESPISPTSASSSTFMSPPQSVQRPRKRSLNAGARLTVAIEDLLKRTIGPSATQQLSKSTVFADSLLGASTSSTLLSDSLRLSLSTTSRDDASNSTAMGRSICQTFHSMMATSLSHSIMSRLSSICRSDSLMDELGATMNASANNSITNFLMQYIASNQLSSSFSISPSSGPSTPLKRPIQSQSQPRKSVKSGKSPIRDKGETSPSSIVTVSTLTPTTATPTVISVSTPMVRRPILTLYELDISDFISPSFSRDNCADFEMKSESELARLLEPKVSTNLVEYAEQCSSWDAPTHRCDYDGKQSPKAVVRGIKALLKSSVKRHTRKEKSVLPLQDVNLSSGMTLRIPNAGAIFMCQPEKKQSEAKRAQITSTDAPLCLSNLSVNRQLARWTQ